MALLKENPDVKSLAAPCVPPTVAAVLVVATVCWLWKRHDKTFRLPPGPKGTPVLGYLPFLGRNHHQMFLELSEIYGPIVRVKIGTVDVVVLNDIESIKEGFTNAALQSRIHNLFLNQTGCPGVNTLNGEAWEDNRRLSMRILRDLGLGKESLMQVIQEEVGILTKTISTFNKKPIIIRHFLVPSVSNIITFVLFGERYPREHKERAALDALFRKAGQALSAGSIIVFLPSWTYKIAGMIPFTRIRAVKTSFCGLMGFIRNKAMERERSLREDHSRDYIDAYLKSTKEYLKYSANAHITKEYIPGNVLSFFGAGTNALTRSIVWHLLNCADKPDTVQKRIQDEIDRVVGRDRLPVWKDRPNMPYTMAVIHEMFRWRTVAPLGMPRGTSEDITICGYDIPKGTIVMANFWALNMSSQHWEQPEIFNPSRFLDDDGTIPKIKPEHFIPFSTGKRMCPVEELATVEIFCYITGILQNFFVLPNEGARIDFSVDCGTFNAAKAQELRFIPR